MGWKWAIPGVFAAVLFFSVPVAGQTDPAPTEIPLRMVDGRLVVTVSGSGGAEFDFLIHTGTNETALSQRLVEQLGLDAELRLGSLAIAQDGREAWRDAALQVGGRVFDGQLGVNTLGEYDVLLDVPRGLMRLGSVGSAGTWNDVQLSDPMRVRVMHGTAMMFEVELNGRQYPAVLDLATATLVVNSGVESDLQLDAQDHVDLTLSSAHLPSTPVRVVPLDIFEMWSPNGDGVVVVGTAPLKTCAIALSWARAELRTCGS